jgi:hypothetical protein
MKPRAASNQTMELTALLACLRFGRLKHFYFEFILGVGSGSSSYSR